MSSELNPISTRNLHDESYWEDQAAHNLDEAGVGGGDAGRAARYNNVQQATEREEHPRNELERTNSER